MTMAELGVRRASRPVLLKHLDFFLDFTVSRKVLTSLMHSKQVGRDV
jgi:hypothetical protein